MAERYMFFNSTATDRRRYQASDMADYWQSFLTNGVINEGNDVGLKVVANDSVSISVALGRAIIMGHLYLNIPEGVNDILTKDIEVASANEDRFDRIVLRYDDTIENRFIKVFVKQGDSSGPPPLTREGDIYELSLAQIHVKAGKSFIEQSDIIDERLDDDLCGLASSLVKVPTDVFNSQLQEMYDEWRDWFDEQQTEGFVLQTEFTEELSSKINLSEKGSPEGLATLSTDGLISEGQIRDLVVYPSDEELYNDGATEYSRDHRNLNSGDNFGTIVLTLKVSHAGTYRISMRIGHSVHRPEKQVRVQITTGSNQFQNKGVVATASVENIPTVGRVVVLEAVVPKDETLYFWLRPHDLNASQQVPPAGDIAYLSDVRLLGTVGTFVDEGVTKL